MKKLVKVITAASAMMMLVGCGQKKEPHKDPFAEKKDEQLVFEEGYINSNFSYAEGGKFAVSVTSQQVQCSIAQQQLSVASSQSSLR